MKSILLAFCLVLACLCAAPAPVHADHCGAFGLCGIGQRAGGAVKAVGGKVRGVFRFVLRRG